jgi:hypothetical protein
LPHMQPSLTISVLCAARTTLRCRCYISDVLVL